MSEPAGSPSWATAPSSSRAAPSRRVRSAEPVPVTLAVAAALITVMVVVEVVHLLGRSDLVPAMRAFLALVVGSQLVLAWGLLRRSSGAALGVYLCEATTVLAAVAGGLGSGMAQPLLGIGAVAVMALLSVSMRAFPRPELPTLPPGRVG